MIYGAYDWDDNDSIATHIWPALDDIWPWYFSPNSMAFVSSGAFHHLPVWGWSVIFKHPDISLTIVSFFNYNFMYPPYFSIQDVQLLIIFISRFKQCSSNNHNPSTSFMQGYIVLEWCALSENINICQGMKCIWVWLLGIGRVLAVIYTSPWEYIIKATIQYECKFTILAFVQDCVKACPQQWNKMFTLCNGYCLCTWCLVLACRSS